MPPEEAPFRDLWQWRVQTSPDDVCLVRGQRRLTYAEVDRSLNRVAHGLLRAGLGKGSRIAYQLPNDVDLFRIELAAQLIGAVTVPIIPGLTWSETTYVLEQARPHHLVVDRPGWEVLDAGGGIGAGLECHTSVIDPGGPPLGGLETDETTPTPDVDIRPHDPMSIRYTSGSTGRPKGVVQPAGGFGSAGHAIARRLEIDADDNLFCVLPLFHVAGTHMMLAPALVAGGRFTLVPTFSRSTFWDDVRDSGGTIALLVPAQISILMTPEPRADDADNPMRIIFSHVRPQSFCDRFDIDVCTMWGMTEISGMGTLTSPGYRGYRPQLIGWPMPDQAEVKVVDEHGHRVEHGRTGELCFRHPYVMSEYYRDERNTAAALCDGWVHTGDLCSMDGDRRVYFHGRLKNVVKRAGENIAGEEVEFSLMEHPAVEEAVVFGVPDPIRTEEVCAIVVAREGERLGVTDLVRWCEQHLVEWKIPRYISITGSSLPRLANGKTDRGAATGPIAASATFWDRQVEAATDLVRGG
jgi:carnitine-CoA ligase